jgi:hypothetical protein
MAENEESPSGEAQPRRLSPPLKRLLITCVLLLGFWVFFLQFTPQTLQQYTPPELQMPAPAAEKPAPPKPMEETEIELPPILHEPAVEPVKLKALQDEPEEAEVDAESVARLRTVEDKLDRLLESAVRGQAESEDMKTLREKLEEHERSIEALKAEQQVFLRVIALLDAYDRLKERLYEGRPFLEELERMQSLAGDDAKLTIALEELRPHAPGGIPGLESLRTGFETAARKALTPRPEKNASFADKISANISGVVSVRRVGDVPGSTADAIIARAESALVKGDVEAATLEVAALQKNAGAAMQAWLADAKAYLARESALSHLKSAIAALKAAS